MRKEITSATLELEEIATLGIIAKREYQGNRSAALRAIVREAGAKRGLVLDPSNQPPRTPAEVNHAATT